MKIVVDTNIVFSAIVNSSGKIGDLLMNSGGQFEFFACDFLRAELFRHREKLQKISKLTDEQMETSKLLIFSKITFLNTALIPKSVLADADTMVADIDPDDTEHVAMAVHLDAKLWTGDLKLLNGLRQSGSDLAVLTAELFALRQDS